MVSEDQRILRAIAKERCRLANTLHDGALSQLVLARNDVAAIRNGRPGALESHLRRLTAISQLLRDVTNSLDDEALDHLPLNAALNRIAEAQRALTRSRIDVDVAPEADAFYDPLIREAAREFIANAIRHGAATRIAVTVDVVATDLELQVSDDGTSVDQERIAVSRAEGHRGLQHIERIAISRGGTLTLRPHAPKGTVATLRVPQAALQSRAQRIDALKHDPAALTASEILEAAEERDGIVAHKVVSAQDADEAAAARDRRAAAEAAAAAAADAAAAAAAGDVDAGVVARAAQTRARAAADREASRIDREQAAEVRRQLALDRLHAAADRTTLARRLMLADANASTKIRTRGAGLGQLEREIERTHRTNGPFTLVAIVIGAPDTPVEPVDRDEPFERVIMQITDHLRPYDLLIRIGSDELLCAMSNVTAYDAAGRFAAITAAVTGDARGPSITAGFAQLRPGESAEDLIARAEAALIEQQSTDRQR